MEKKSFDLIFERAQEGDVYSQDMLAYCYMAGKCVEKDEAKAYEWIEKVAIQEKERIKENKKEILKKCRIKSSFSIYPNIDSIDDIDDSTYEKLYKQAYFDDPLAQYILGMYDKKHGKKNNQDWLINAAQNGLPDANYELGLSHESLHHFEMAAKVGHKKAQCEVAKCHKYGIDTKKDEIKAFCLFLKFALQGNEIAQYELAKCYELGVGTEKNKTKAFEWYEKSANNECKNAQYRLAWCYKIGVGTEKDDKKASNWYEKYTRYITVINKKKLDDIFIKNCEIYDVIGSSDEMDINEFIDLMKSPLQKSKEKCDNFGRTELMRTIRQSANYEIIKSLVLKGADVNAKDNNGENALMFAARYSDDPRIIKLLLWMDADVNVHTKNGTNVLWFGSKNSTPAKYEIQKLLEPYARKIQSKTQKVQANIQFLKQIQNRKMQAHTINELIKNGAYINEEDESGGWTALMVACYTDDIESVKILLENGADVNIRKNGGGTALMIAACSCKNDDIISLLLENGANINAKDEDGMTALMYASRYSCEENIIRILEQAGAYLDEKDYNGNTASDYVKLNKNLAKASKRKRALNEKLINVIEQGLRHCVSSYLNEGADKNAKRESDGKSALQIAKEKGDEEIIALLKQYGAKE